ncbi:facilitated trehalose transporter Tret1-2 homolog [Oratosquilla oratoria]|uniref:facilitated trehalose transporter Tret1-2 homolog n=1 Tax=Oratosquilla oratoria TaxID=337810 RepID=UPI003F76182A
MQLVPQGRQIASAFAVAGGSLLEGYVIGWPNVLLDLLPPAEPSPQTINGTGTNATLPDADAIWALTNNTRTTKEFTLSLSENDIGQLAALPSVAAITLVTLPSIMINYLGLRGVEILGVSLAIVQLLLMAFLPSMMMFYVGRFLTGIFSVLIMVASQPLVSELVSPKIRGIMCSLPRMMVSLGMLQVYILASYLPWNLTTATCAAALTPVLLHLVFIPESPYWLVKKGRKEAAAAALASLQVPPDQIKEELEEIASCVNEKTEEIGLMEQIRRMRSPSNYKPFLLMITICILEASNGNAIVLTYSTLLFCKAGVELDPRKCSIYVGITRFLAMLVGALIIDKIGRRPLLISSALLCTFSLTLTTCSLAIDRIPNCMVVAGVIMYMASTSAGCNLLPYVLLGEIIPSAIQAVGCSICLEFSELFFSIFAGATPAMLQAIGLAYLFLVPAGANVALALVTWLWLPETRGRTLLDSRTSFEPWNKGSMDLLNPELATEKIYN